MKTVGFVSVIIIASLTFGYVYAQQQIVNESVVGTMKNQGNQPISLKFEFVNGTQDISQFTSTSNGSFNMNLPKGSYDWKLSTASKQPEMPRFFEVEKQVDLTSNILQNLIPITFTISGKITDQNGNPLSDATFDSGVCDINIGNFTGSEEDVTTTDSNGTYTSYLLPSTCSSIKIITQSGQTFFPMSGRTIQVNGNITNNMQLSTSVTIKGTVTDQNSNPVFATVQFVGQDFTETTATDPLTGKYSISIPPSSGYTIKFSQDGMPNSLPRFYDIERPISLLSDQTINMIENTTSVSGISEFNSAIIDVRNNLVSGSYTGYSEDQVTTDSNGHFAATLLSSSITQVTIQNDNTEVLQQCTLSGNIITC